MHDLKEGRECAAVSLRTGFCASSGKKVFVVPSGERDMSKLGRNFLPSSETDSLKLNYVFDSTDSKQQAGSPIKLRKGVYAV